jgi:hypothetical protein
LAILEDQFDWADGLCFICRGFDRPTRGPTNSNKDLLAYFQWFPCCHLTSPCQFFLDDSVTAVSQFIQRSQALANCLSYRIGDEKGVRYVL